MNINDPRINFKYYDTIDKIMSKLYAETGRATIGDAINAMRSLGNRTYIEDNAELDPAKIQEPLADGPDKVHEASHIGAELGHSPQAEQWAAIVQRGLSDHTILRKNGKAIIQDHLADAMRFSAEMDQEYFKEKNSTNIIPPNKRQTAIYYALGAYLNQRLNNFYEQGLDKKSYEEQRNFARNYGMSDTMKFLGMNQNDRKLDESFPYEMLKLSREEWRAIIGVATGLREPEQTKYANRLRPIAEALQFLGLRENLRPNVKRILEHHPLNEESFANAVAKKDPNRFINRSDSTRER